MENGNENGKKPGRWGYERHIVQCPECGADMLDHMTECPKCGAEVNFGGLKPISPETLRRVRIVALVVGIIIALIIVVPILIKKFGG